MDRSIMNTLKKSQNHYIIEYQLYRLNIFYGTSLALDVITK